MYRDQSSERRPPRNVSWVLRYSPLREFELRLFALFLSHLFQSSAVGTLLRRLLFKWAISRLQTIPPFGCIVRLVSHPLPFHPPTTLSLSLHPALFDSPPPPESIRRQSPIFASSHASPF